MRRTWSVLLATVLLACASASAKPKPPPPPKPEPVDPYPADLAGWDALLHERVADGVPDYAKLKSDPRLKTYVLRLAQTPEPPEPAKRTALLLNAYNAFVLWGLAERWPVAKVTDLEEFSAQPAWALCGRRVSLDSLDADWLRPLAEPRLRAALPSGAVSGAPFRREAYDPQRLDAQLDDQVRRLVSDPRRVRLDREAHKLWLSPLFRWYARDLDPVGGPAALVRAGLANVADQDWLAAGAFDLAWLDYDWSVPHP